MFGNKDVKEFADTDDFNSKIPERVPHDLKLIISLCFDYSLKLSFERLETLFYLFQPQVLTTPIISITADTNTQKQYVDVNNNVSTECVLNTLEVVLQKLRLNPDLQENEISVIQDSISYAFFLRSSF
jgi:hypothetical protein